MEYSACLVKAWISTFKAGYSKNMKINILVLVVVDDIMALLHTEHMKKNEDGKNKKRCPYRNISKGDLEQMADMWSNQTVIHYLRESAATYIYSNSISPSVAGAAHASVKLMTGSKGQKLLEKSRTNIALFKKLSKQLGLSFAADSQHPIQPVLIGDPLKTKKLTQELFQRGIMVSSINYPVVPKGRDEIRCK